MRRLFNSRSPLFWLLVALAVASVLLGHSKAYLLGNVALDRYYVSAGILLALAYLGRLLSRDAQSSILLVMGATIGSLYAFNLFLAFRPVETLDTATILRAGNDFDARSRLEVIEDLQARGVRAAPSISPGNDYARGDGIGILEPERTHFLPLSGISSRTTVMCNESGEWVVYESDRHGFNNPPDSWSNERPEAMLIGDSYAHGYCVQQDETVAARLRERGVSTISVGMAGTGPLLQYALFKEYVEPLQPREVIWLYFEHNDLRDLNREKQYPFLLSYLDGTVRQDLLNRQDEIDHLLEGFVAAHLERATGRDRFVFGSDVLYLRSVRRLLNESARYFRRAYYAPMDFDKDLFTRIFREVRESVEAWGGTVVFVYLPYWDRYAFDDLQESLDRRFHRAEIIEIIEALGIEAIDIHAEAFSLHPDPLALFPLRRPGHYVNEGHDLVARTVFERLRRAH